MSWIWGILIFGILLLSGYFLLTYNSIIKVNNAIKELVSSVDVALKNRAELIPDLTVLVKLYCYQESLSLENMMKERSSTQFFLDESFFIRQNKISLTLSTIFASSENYPELKASQSFLQLQNQLVEMEERIAAAKIAYNDGLTRLFEFRDTFPKNVVFTIMRIPQYVYY